MCCRHTRGKSSFPAVLYAGIFQLEPPKLLLYCRGVCHVLLSGSVITGSLWPSSPIVPFCTDDALLHRLAWIGSSFHHRVQAMLSRIFEPGSSFQNRVQAHALSLRSARVKLSALLSGDAILTLCCSGQSSTTPVTHIACRIQAVSLASKGLLLSP